MRDFLTMFALQGLSRELKLSANQLAQANIHDLLLHSLSFFDSLNIFRRYVEIVICDTKLWSIYIYIYHGLYDGQWYSSHLHSSWTAAEKKSYQIKILTDARQQIRWKEVMTGRKENSYCKWPNGIKFVEWRCKFGNCQRILFYYP